MKILYFASIREKIGHGEDDASLPSGVASVADLVAWLQTRGPNYARALGDLRGVRVAVNQEHVKFDHPVANDDEIALFPPVTGG
ncbi:MAG: moaD [Rhodospirillales bacterium]|jgi:molybdopterin synthase sulfur carrier subunit|nr:moaD [Rhodospirillales bacterium]